MNSQLKVLCLAPYPVEGPSARYRVLQFLPYLRAQGMVVDYRPFMDSWFYKRFYQPGRKSRKALQLMGQALRRAVDVKRARDYDVVFIHREAALFGPPVFETLIARLLETPIVFDFDDAIHVSYISPTYGKLASLVKFPQKTPQTIRISQAIVAGNRHLEEYAKTLNPNVSMIPTVVDSNVVRPAQSTLSARDEPIVLGWMGSHSTYPYLESLFPVLREVAKRHNIMVRIVGAGRDIEVAGVRIDNRKWSLQTELADLQSFDIGLYPIVEDEWSLGKSGFKAVEYMAVGIPAVCSPVGATRDIVRDGIEGFLPNDALEWTGRLCHLIEDAEARHTLGQAGRRRIEEWFCLRQQAPRLQNVLESATRQKETGDRRQETELR